MVLHSVGCGRVSHRRNQHGRVEAPPGPLRKSGPGGASPHLTSILPPAAATQALRGRQRIPACPGSVPGHRGSPQALTQRPASGTYRPSASAPNRLVAGPPHSSRAPCRAPHVRGIARCAMASRAAGGPCRVLVRTSRCMVREPACPPE